MEAIRRERDRTELAQSELRSLGRESLSIVDFYFFILNFVCVCVLRQRVNRNFYIKVLKQGVLVILFPSWILFPLKTFKIFF